MTSFSRTDRMCHKDCKIGDLNIKEGVRVVIPIHAIHYNPVLYPDPEKFDPDRFLGDDGSKAGSSTLEYLPFGAGPRVCIGMRFAMTEMKIATAKLLSKFKLLDDPKTALEYDTGDVFLLSYPGINIKVERRSQWVGPKACARPGKFGAVKNSWLHVWFSCKLRGGIMIP